MGHHHRRHHRRSRSNSRRYYDRRLFVGVGRLGGNSCCGNGCTSGCSWGNSCGNNCGGCGSGCGRWGYSSNGLYGVGVGASYYGWGYDNYDY